MRNGARVLQATLDGMAMYCDCAYVVDDRSSDATPDILAAHPLVANTFRVDPTISSTPWHFAESTLLNLLYRCADLDRPDWIVCLDDDQRLVPGDRIREALQRCSADVAGLVTKCVSVWADPEYPDMVPLMGSATSVRGNVWRYYPGLEPGRRLLHNGHLPINLGAFGQVVSVGTCACYHHGWDTLARRIETVRRYNTVDPRADWNRGVPYDRALLFGYALSEVDELIRDYRRRFSQRARRHELAAVVRSRVGVGQTLEGSRLVSGGDGP